MRSYLVRAAEKRYPCLVKLRFAVLADYANVTGDGKINILGVLDQIYAYAFPATHRELVVVNSFETENTEDGAKLDMGVKIIDPDGHTLSEIGGVLQIAGLRQVVNQIHVFQDLEFQMAGAHEVHLLVDHATVHVMELNLVKIQEPDPPS